MKLLKRTWADVSLDNLAHNVKLLRDRVEPGCIFLGVVKADAYGHGAIPISRRLKELGADYLAVSNLEEAIQIRRGGIWLPILVLGYTPPVYAEDMASMGICQEVHALEYAKDLSQALDGTDKTLTVHLKLDTGMSRLGFFAYDRPQTYDELIAVSRLPHLEVEGIFTHFPVSDSLSQEDQSFTQLQYTRFTAMAQALRDAGLELPIRHCCNSGATLLHPEYCLDMIRPGIATYGISPSEELEGMYDLRPLMSLRTTISQVRDFEPGVTVSYGRTYTTPSPRKIAVAAIGYADGLHRALSGRVSFLLHGKRVPVVGRICMDMCMLDVTEVPDTKPGDVVTVFGRDGADFIPVDDLAKKMQTIPYETLCDVNKRIPRIYLDGTKRMEILQYIV